MPLISRTIDLPYASIVCREAFNRSMPADVSRINKKYGGFQIHYENLAFIDGQWDPWRWAGVHAPAAPKRKSTAIEPSILIDDAVHHWDENGLFPNETTRDLPPPQVLEVKENIRNIVRDWLEEWNSGRQV